MYLGRLSQPELSVPMMLIVTTQRSAALCRGPSPAPWVRAAGWRCDNIRAARPHRGRGHTSAYACAKKFFSSALPASVMIDSG